MANGNSLKTPRLRLVRIPEPFGNLREFDRHEELKNQKLIKESATCTSSHRDHYSDRGAVVGHGDAPVHARYLRMVINSFADAELIQNPDKLCLAEKNRVETASRRPKRQALTPANSSPDSRNLVNFRSSA
jgi:hypothetical protein